MTTLRDTRAAPLALVTGAPGWLGTRLVEALARGLPGIPACDEPLDRPGIRCLVQRGADSSPLEQLPGVVCVTGDLTDPPSLIPFVAGAPGATLFHCAGVIHPRRSSEFEAVNAVGTRNLLDAATSAGVRRFVHVSSNSPFGANTSSDPVFDETSSYNPYMGYGRSKMAAELAVRAAGSNGRIETVIIRAPWFYGPGQPPRQTLFFTMIRQGRFPLLGDGNSRRSMTYVDDLCQGILLAERVDRARGEAFWIAGERPCTMNEIVETVERVLERDFSMSVSHRRTRLPSLFADVARVADRVIQAMGLYEQKIHVLSEMNLSIVCSVEKAKRELGYRPTVGLEEGMRRSLEWVFSKGLTV